MAYDKLVEDRRAALRRRASLDEQRYEQAVLLRFRESLSNSWPKRKRLPEWQRQQEWVPRNSAGESLPCMSMRTDANQGSHATPMEFYWHAVSCEEKRTTRINLRRGHLAFPKKLSGQLNGSLAILGELPALQDLDVSNHNKALRGSLPERFGGVALFPELRMARFSGNWLRGQLPETLPPKLRWLDLGNCRSISGTLPTWKSHAQLLETVVLSNNSLTGTVPSSMFSMPFLSTLLLDGNGLQGECAFPMPDIMVCLTGRGGAGTLALALTGDDAEPSLSLGTLHTLSFRNNALSGSLPRFFSKMTKVSPTPPYLAIILYTPVHTMYVTHTESDHLLCTDTGEPRVSLRRLRLTGR